MPCRKIEYDLFLNFFDSVLITLNEAKRNFNIAWAMIHDFYYAIILTPLASPAATLPDYLRRIYFIEWSTKDFKSLREILNFTI